MPEKLSRMSVHFVISRADSNKHVYQVDMIPRQPKKQKSDESSAGAQHTLLEFGFLLKVATAANSSTPPASGSWDGGSVNVLINGAKVRAIVN